MLYTETDIEKSMSKIETVNFHQEMDVNGIRFWCYTAGHVLGAAMFMIEIAGVKVNKSKTIVWPHKSTFQDLTSFKLFLFQLCSENTLLVND